MGLFDQYGGVKKHGHQIYRKDNVLIDKALCDKTWDRLSYYFTKEKSDLNLMHYFGGYGITASHTEYYCTEENYEKYIKDIIKEELKKEELKKKAKKK